MLLVCKLNYLLISLNFLFETFLCSLILLLLVFLLTCHEFTQHKLTTITVKNSHFDQIVWIWYAAQVRNFNQFSTLWMLRWLLLAFSVVLQFFVIFSFVIIAVSACVLPFIEIAQDEFSFAACVLSNNSLELFAFALK